MPINPDIRDQAYQFFIEEAPELLQVIEAGLLTLKQERSTAKVHDLMRAAHSLKGGAASVELEAIKTLAHRLENIFKALYNETVDIDTDLESQLLQAYDCLRLPLMEQIQNGSFDAEQALEIANPIFINIEQRLGEALNQADTYIPSSSDLGIDMARSIFEVDVAEGLERLSAVLAHPENYEVAGELRAECEVFVGFAELLNQPGFGAIAQAAITALDTHPNLALEITQIALSDFQSAREAVLSGQTTQAINPSVDLLALANMDATPAPDLAAMDDAEIAQTEAIPIIEETEDIVPTIEDVFSVAFEETDALSCVVDNQDKEEQILLTNTTSLEQESDGNTAFIGEEDTEADTLECQPPEIEETTPENLDEAIQSIGEIFEQLPPLQEFPTPIPLSSPATNSTDAASILPVESATPEVLPETSLSVQTPAPLQGGDRANIPTKGDRITPDIRPDKASPVANLSVRVDSERLERMNNVVGELAINRNGLSLQNQQLQRSVRELLERFTQVQNMVSQLRELSDKMLVAPERYNQGTMTSIAHQLEDLLARQADFDSLELDSYGVLNARLQGLIEDMVQLEEAVDDVALFAKQSDQTLEQQRQMLTQLRDELMWARMLPLSEVLNRFPRVLRDLSTQYHKPVHLELKGTGVLVDKAALEKLYDPLLHLLRNAFDHGIEPPEIRCQQGKSEQGLIEIRAYHQGSQTIIEVKDDGRGLDRDRIGQRAVELGLLSAEQLANTTNSRLYEFLFEPGFSTTTEVSELSGRGVGLDVVRSHMRSLKGNISVASSPGMGTGFTLRLPLTMTIAKLLVCLIGSTALAIPSDSVEEIVIPKADQVQNTGEQRFLRWRGHIVPTYRLGDLLDYSCPLPDAHPSKALESVPSPNDWALPILILRQEQQVLALEIDRLVTEQELVIKPFGSAIAPPSFTYGCTILGDGSLIPVIDGTVLLDQLLGHVRTSTQISTAAKSISLGLSETSLNTKTNVKTRQSPTVLVVDDAVALRRTLALTLERAGCRVLQARDGREALEQLRQSTRISLVVCDIEMPNMNGFEFLGQRRQDSRLSEIPVVMLTSRSNDKHRWLAMRLGATAYFTKPYLEQEFLAAIKGIIDQKNSESTEMRAPNPPLLQSS